MAVKKTFSETDLDQISQLKYLTDRERLCFQLYYIRGWRLEDIAMEVFVVEKKRSDPTFENKNYDTFDTEVVARALASVRRKYANSKLKRD